MKKNIKILFSLLITGLVLVGCGNNKNENEKKANKKEVKTGQKIEIKVENNNSEYYWDWELFGDDNAIISYTSEEKKCEDGQDNCGETEIYTLTATAAGNSTFKLKYSNSDEENDDALTAIYEITVDKDLNISEKHSGSYFEQKQTN